MALKWVDGFESYSNLINYLQYRYSTFTGPSASFQPGRAIGNSLRFNGTTFITPTFGNNITWTVGFAFMNVNLAASNTWMPLVEIRDTTTSQITLSFNPSTRLFRVQRGSTVLGTGTFAITTGYWYYIEIQATIDPTSGSVTSKVNTVSDVTFSGNTQVTANTYANNIAFDGPAGIGIGGAYEIDDVYINDSTGGSNTSFLGDMKVEAVTPIAGGTNTNWGVNLVNTPNFECVQTLNDGLYIQSATSGQVDTYSTSKLNRITGSIAGMQIVYWARNTDSTTHTIKSDLWIAGSGYINATAITINDTAFKAYQQIWETDPSTGVAFITSGINILELGVKLNS